MSKKHQVIAAIFAIAISSTTSHAQDGELWRTEIGLDMGPLLWKPEVTEECRQATWRSKTTEQFVRDLLGEGKLSGCTDGQARTTAKGWVWSAKCAIESYSVEHITINQDETLTRWTTTSRNPKLNYSHKGKAIAKRLGSCTPTKDY